MTDKDHLDATTSIVIAALTNLTVTQSEIPTLIASVHASIGNLGAPAPVAEPEKPVPAVSIRSSVRPDVLISLIDGKPYKTLKRHLSRHGYTPESYRAAYGLASSYPMVAAEYTATRKKLAIENGLGRRA